VTESTVKPGTVVSITYVLHNEHGEIVEVHDLPVAYVHGAGGDLFPLIEQALENHKVGDRVEVELPPEEGFGAHDPNLTFTDDLENTPPEIRHLGAEVQAENERGEQRTFRVTRIADGKLTVDANHPLAGQTVRFVVSIAAIRPATKEEMRQGVPQTGAPPVLQ
jgi:FKBP-type peptidyl-prolyl cis-trans isomerase SlyD